jgi:hypothetical protein
LVGIFEVIVETVRMAVTMNMIRGAKDRGETLRVSVRRTTTGSKTTSVGRNKELHGIAGMMIVFYLEENVIRSADDALSDTTRTYAFPILQAAVLIIIMRTEKKHRRLMSRVARKKWPDSHRGARETMDGCVIRVLSV